MIKSVFAAAAASVVSAGAAVAGPYVNVETNAGWTGNDYKGQATDLHVGYEGELSKGAAWYVQAGPQLRGTSGKALETAFSGKAGVGVDVTSKLNVYGEISAATATEDFVTDDMYLGAKLGAKYSF